MYGMNCVFMSKIADFALVTKRNNSFKKILKRIGPTIDPRGTPDRSILNELGFKCLR